MFQKPHAPHSLECSPFYTLFGRLNNRFHTYIFWMCGAVVLFLGQGCSHKSPPSQMADVAVEQRGVAYPQGTADAIEAERLDAPDILHQDDVTPMATDAPREPRPVTVGVLLPLWAASLPEAHHEAAQGIVDTLAVAMAMDHPGSRDQASLTLPIIDSGGYDHLTEALRGYGVDLVVGPITSEATRLLLKEISESQSGKDDPLFLVLSNDPSYYYERRPQNVWFMASTFWQEITVLKDRDLPQPITVILPARETVQQLGRTLKRELGGKVEVVAVEDLQDLPKVGTLYLPFVVEASVTGHPKPVDSRGDLRILYGTDWLISTDQAGKGEGLPFRNLATSQIVPTAMVSPGPARQLVVQLAAALKRPPTLTELEAFAALQVALYLWHHRSPYASLGGQHDLIRDVPSILGPISVGVDRFASFPLTYKSL